MGLDPVLETLADLIRINSVNPNYDGGVPEAELARYVEGFFERRGIETWRQTVFPQRDQRRRPSPGPQSESSHHFRGAPGHGFGCRDDNRSL